MEPKPATNGAQIKYRLPMSNGWRVLDGTIVNLTDTAMVVKERYFGGQSTIDHSWFVCYDWSHKQSAAKAEAFTA